MQGSRPAEVILRVEPRPWLPCSTAALSLFEQPCRSGVAGAEAALLRIRTLRRIAQPGGPTAGGKRIDRTRDPVAAKHNEEMSGADTRGPLGRCVVLRTIQKSASSSRSRAKCHRAGRRLGESERSLTPAACPSSPDASFASRAPPATRRIGRCRPERQPVPTHAITIRVAGAVLVSPHTSPTMTRAIFSPPTDDGSIGLA